MNYNNSKNNQVKEDPFAFLKGDDVDFNESLKELDDMFNAVYEKSERQKKEEEQYAQKRKLLNEVAANKNITNTPGVVMGVPVQEGQYQTSQNYSQFNQLQSEPSFDQNLYVKQQPNYNNGNTYNIQGYPQMSYQQQYYNQPPIQNVQFPQQVNYNYPQQNQGNFNTRIN